MTLNRSFFRLTSGFLLLCTSAIALAIATNSTRAPQKPYSIGIAAGVVALILLWFESRRDLDPVLILVIAFLCGLALCTGVYILGAVRPGIVSKITLPVAVLLIIPLGMITFRRQRTESAQYPNYLARTVPAKSIFESEGVQFTGFLEPAQGGKPHFINVLLQNCFDGPCEVTMRFDPAGYAKYMQLYPRHAVTLGAAEIAKVTFPVITPTYPGNYPLYYSIDVKRRQGKRVRLWRAQEASTRIKPTTTLALAAMGHIAFGGGIRFMVGPLPYELWNSPLPPPAYESLWRPPTSR